MNGRMSDVRCMEDDMMKGERVLPCGFAPLAEVCATLK